MKMSMTNKVHPSPIQVEVIEVKDGSRVITYVKGLFLTFQNQLLKQFGLYLVN